jgi:hypothetical protein
MSEHIICVCNSMHITLTYLQYWVKSRREQQKKKKKRNIIFKAIISKKIKQTNKHALYSGLFLGFLTKLKFNKGHILDS